MHIYNSTRYNQYKNCIFGNQSKLVQKPALKHAIKNTVEKFNTDSELSRILFEVKTGQKLTPTEISKLNKSACIGKISNELQDLLDEIGSLHEKINTVLLFFTDKDIYKLKKEYPNFSKYKPYSEITFNKINNTGIGLTLHNNLIKNSNDEIRYICIHNKSNSITDILAFDGSKILKTKNNLNFNRHTNLSNYLIKDEYLTQEEIDSKNISFILNILKKELSSTFELISNGGGIIDEDISYQILNLEKDIFNIKKQISTKKIRPKNVKIYPCGAIEFSNINTKGEKLYWLPADRNKKLPNTTIINLISADNKLIDGIALNDERIASNYPTEHKDNIPQVLKFYTSEEIKKLNLEEKLENFIKLFEKEKSDFDKKFEKISNFKKNLSNIF